MILLIDENGTNQGMVKYADAKRRASAAELDLVQVSKKGVNPQVFKIVDKGKIAYKQSKQKKPAKTMVKEHRIRPNIGGHDLTVKEKACRKHLAKGHTAKIVLTIRGRERFTGDPKKSLNDLLLRLEDVGISSPTKQDRNKVIATVRPK